jgi:site-specific recombinase XerD
MPIVNLTAEMVAKHLQCPDGKRRVEWCDSEVPGLYVEIRATAERQGTYYLRYKNKVGKTCHQKLGRTTDISLSDARKAAKALRGQVVQGADPRAEKKSRKEVPLWEDFFSLQYVPYAKPRKRTWAGDVQLNVRIGAKFGLKRLDEITRREIEDFHTSLLDEGLSPATADQHLRLIKRGFNLAVAWEVIEKNPAANVKLLRVDNKRGFYLNDEQLARLMQVLRTDSARTVCQLAMFLLATGARLSEATRATWTQIDREHRVWRIPAANSKSKKMRSVPLNDQALAVLQEVGTEGKFEHVFINHRWINADGSRGKPIKWVQKVFSRIRIEAGLPACRLHDLRHNHASFLVNAGRTLYEVQQVLGHSDPAVTMRYAHLSTKTMLEASSAASLVIERAIKAGQVASASSGVLAASGALPEAPGPTLAAEGAISDPQPPAALVVPATVASASSVASGATGSAITFDSSEPASLMTATEPALIPRADHVPLKLTCDSAQSTPPTTHSTGSYDASIQVDGEEAVKRAA